MRWFRRRLESQPEPPHLTAAQPSLPRRSPPEPKKSRERARCWHPSLMGSRSAAFKSFMEDSFVHAWRKQLWKDKLAAEFTNSAGRSGDKLATLLQLAIFAAQHGMVIVSLGELPGHITSDGGEHEINRFSSFVGLMGQSNSDQGPDASTPLSDRETGRRFGA